MRKNRARPEKLVLMKHDPVGKILYTSRIYIYFYIKLFLMFSYSKQTRIICGNESKERNSIKITEKIGHVKKTNCLNEG